MNTMWVFSKRCPPEGVDDWVQTALFHRCFGFGTSVVTCEGHMVHDDRSILLYKTDGLCVCAWPAWDPRGGEVFELDITNAARTRSEPKVVNATELVRLRRVLHDKGDAGDKLAKPAVDAGFETPLIVAVDDAIDEMVQAPA